MDAYAGVLEQWRTATSRPVERRISLRGAISRNAYSGIRGPVERCRRYRCPVPSWAQFATRLLAVTLPVHYPGEHSLTARQSRAEAQTRSPASIESARDRPDRERPAGHPRVEHEYPNTFATLGEALGAGPARRQRDPRTQPEGLKRRTSRRSLDSLRHSSPASTRLAGSRITNPRGEGIISSDRDHPATRSDRGLLRLVAGQTLS